MTDERPTNSPTGLSEADEETLAGLLEGARRGGYVSGLPMASGYSGILVPVGPSDTAPPRLPAPHPGYPRKFVWEIYASEWDQFLIRDLHPDRPFDYFREHADKVELVERAGRWRLYRRTQR